MTKNNPNSFVVEIPGADRDPNLFYKKGFMDLLKQYPHLTVAGQNPPPVGHGVEFAGPGNLLTVGTADKHDVEWIRNPNFARERGLAPVYDLIKDWNTVTAKLKTYADSKRTYTTESGAKVTFEKNYVKVGYKAYGYNDIKLEVVFTNADIINMYLGLLR